jgi:NO-binding membrane sensor protein with MHYT domain
LDCIRIVHDPKLIVLAVLVSLLSGFTIFAILSHARAQRGSAQYGWSVMAACVAGGGIWSTHFIAMLGFSPGTAVSYDINLTIISALLGIGISGTAMPFLLSRASISAITGAVVLSTAIGTMHYTGMKALVFGGTLDWEPALVALSLFSAVLLVSAAIFTERLSTAPRYRLVAAALFGAAICCLHFTAMAAAVLKSDPTLAVADGGLSEFLLGLSVAFVTSIIVALSLVTVLFDKRARKASTDADQMRSIIEAAQTGIVVCQNQRVIAANRTFGQLVSLKQEEIEGRPLTNFIATRALTGERCNSGHRDIRGAAEDISRRPRRRRAQRHADSVKRRTTAFDRGARYPRRKSSARAYDLSCKPRCSNRTGESSPVSCRTSPGHRSRSSFMR